MITHRESHKLSSKVFQAFSKCKWNTCKWFNASHEPREDYRHRECLNNTFRELLSTLMFCFSTTLLHIRKWIMQRFRVLLWRCIRHETTYARWSSSCFYFHHHLLHVSRRFKHDDVKILAKLVSRSKANAKQGKQSKLMHDLFIFIIFWKIIKSSRHLQFSFHLPPLQQENTNEMQCSFLNSKSYVFRIQTNSSKGSKNH